MTEYHKQHLRNDILTKLLELARVLGRGPWGGPGQRMLAHLNYLLGLKSSRRADPQPATACPTALCGAGKGSAAAAAAVKEELTQGIWEVMRCINELDSALELFHHGKILCCWPQKRCCHSPPPAEVSFKQFLVFLTTKQSWEKSP